MTALNFPSITASSLHEQALSRKFNEPDDQKYFRDPLSWPNDAIVARQLIERAVVRAIFLNARESGVLCRVHDGEGWCGPASAETNALMDQIMSVDEETVSFYRMKSDGKLARVGMAVLIYGNDGFDVIADNSANDEVESILAPATQLAERLEDECFDLSTQQQKM